MSGNHCNRSTCHLPCDHDDDQEEITSAALLQENADVTDPDGWMDVVGGETSPVLITVEPGAKSFYRLRQQ